LNDSSPAVVVENLSKFYGRFPALLDVSAEFHYGEVCALLGGNGSGKSTLLRIIAGLAQPTHGRIVFFGNTSREQMGYMAHASLLYDEMSALENLKYFAALYAVQPGRCNEVITSVGLDPALGRLVRDYSQGMRQRLSLARALIQDPSILLLDEPFSNVDADSATRMIDLLRRLKAQGKAIIVVTHQPELIRDVADSILVLRDGRITETRRDRNPLQSHEVAK
jgi:ABC-type multidrug transport system ATPase subunit